MAKNIIALCLVVMIAVSVIYEVQGTPHFLLKMYLRRRFPRRCAAFSPFAVKGMMMLASRLRGGCPATRGFRIFFGNFQNFLQFCNTASASSKNFNVEMNGRADMVAKALGGLTGSTSQAATMKNTMMSMGKTLAQQRSLGSAEMTMQQRTQLVMNMVSWTRTIISLVGTAAQKSGGKPIDQSSYGLDVDVNDSVKGGSEPVPEDTSPMPEDIPATATGTATKSGGAYAKAGGTATKTGGASANYGGSATKTGGASANYGGSGDVSGTATGAGSTDVSGGATGTNDYSAGYGASASKVASGTATTTKGSSTKCTMMSSGACSKQASGGINGQASFKGSYSGSGSLTAGGY